MPLPLFIKNPLGPASISEIQLIPRRSHENIPPAPDEQSILSIHDIDRDVEGTQKAVDTLASFFARESESHAWRLCSTMGSRTRGEAGH